MKIPHLPNSPRSRGFTLIELLVVISIIAILAGFALPVFTSAQKRANLAESLNNAKQIGLALKMFAQGHDGSFPYASKPEDPSSTPVTTSSEAFSLLMPAQIPTKKVFFNKADKGWCSGAAATTTANQYTLGTGENSWAYVGNLTETSDSRWPLIATAFKDNTGTYVKSTSAKGGVWGATDAVVVFVDGSAKMVSNLVDAGKDGAYIPRNDLGTSTPTNMFVPVSGDWLDTAKVLVPQ